MSEINQFMEDLSAKFDIVIWMTKHDSMTVSGDKELWSVRILHIEPGQVQFSIAKIRSNP